MHTLSKNLELQYQILTKLHSFTGIYIYLNLEKWFAAWQNEKKFIWCQKKKKNPNISACLKKKNHIILRRSGVLL